MLEKHRKWVTREKAKVDRIACPWLIKTFVDSEPEFLFVPAERVLDTVKEQNAIPLMFQMLNSATVMENAPLTL
jgi:hypothetical protein